jgi:aminoglycoside 3-N-acetyltransferase
MIEKIERQCKNFLRLILPGSAIEFLLRSVRPSLRAIRRKTWPLLETGSLTNDLRRAGIKEYDVLMVHSSLAKIGNVQNGAETVIKSLMDAVSPEGTIITPCHYSPQEVMDIAAQGKVFDMRSFQPNTGAIPCQFMRWPGVLRSSHPFASSCAWGKYADFVTSGHDKDPRICHKDSPLARLLELKGKLIGIGVSIGPVGFYHVLEDTWSEFPFVVYMPKMPVSYIDASGKLMRRELCRYDPVVAMSRIEKTAGEGIRNALTDHLVKKGILRHFIFGRARSWIMEAQPLYDELKNLAGRGITIYSSASEFYSVMRPGTGASKLEGDGYGRHST